MEIKALIGYDKIRQVGAGQGMNSEVFLVRDPQRNEEVVAKEIARPNLVNDPDKLFQEAHAICAATCANVVPIHYACRTRDKICIVMPFYKSGSLADLIGTNPISPKRAIHLGQQVLNGLAGIHSHGLVHLDIKPTNILMDDHSNALVADFGQARKFDPSTGVATLPAMYWFGMPPEFFTSRVGTVQTDIYQVGMTLYRALNGDPIFSGQKPTNENDLQKAVVGGKFPNRSIFQPHVPRYMRTIIRKALKTDPSKRYDSASSMAQALANVAIKFDWNMSATGTSSLWRAIRPEQADLLVELTEAGNAWDVKFYTERKGIRRGRETSAWKSGLTRKQADSYLTDLFDQWEHA